MAENITISETHYTPLPPEPKNSNKKKFLLILMGIITLLIAGLAIFFTTRSQPQTTSSKAATSSSGCAENTIRGVVIRLCPGVITLSSGGDNATGTFTLTYVSGSSAVTFNVDEESFWCDTLNGQNCQENGRSSVNEHTLSPGGTETITLSRNSDTGEGCGSYQFDTRLEGNGNPVWLYAEAGTCRSTPVPTQPGSTITPTIVTTSAPTPSQAPSPTPTQAPGTFNVSGQVCNLETDRPPACIIQCGFPGNQYAGFNGLIVNLIRNGQVMYSTTTIRGGSGQNGAFYFNNVAPMAFYNVCVIPSAGYQNYCGVPQQPGQPNVDPCAKIPLSSQDATGIRLNVVSTLQSTPASTATPIPTVTTPANTATPVPTAATTPANTPTSVANTPTRAANTPTQPFNTPVPNTPTQAQSTPGVTTVIITATPTPTSIVAVNSTSTPATGVRNASPTIPEAGSPLPLIAIGIPLFFLLLAFIL